MGIEQNDNPVDGGSEVLLRVRFTGVLAFLFGPRVIK